jgi:hypothetical protein
LIDYLQFKEWVSNAMKYQRLKDDDIKARLEAKRRRASNPRSENRKDDEEHSGAQRILNEYETAMPSGIDQAQALAHEM